MQKLLRLARLAAPPVLLIALHTGIAAAPAEARWRTAICTSDFTNGTTECCKWCTWLGCDGCEDIGTLSHER